MGQAAWGQAQWTPANMSLPGGRIPVSSTFMRTRLLAQGAATTKKPRQFWLRSHPVMAPHAGPVLTRPNRMHDCSR